MAIMSLIFFQSKLFPHPLNPGWPWNMVLLKMWGPITPHLPSNTPWDLHASQLRTDRGLKQWWSKMNNQIMKKEIALKAGLSWWEKVAQILLFPFIPHQLMILEGPDLRFLDASSLLWIGLWEVLNTSQQTGCIWYVLT